MQVGILVMTKQTQLDAKCFNQIEIYTKVIDNI
jgi:hypothetical protein